MGRTQQWGSVRLGSFPLSAALMGGESGPLGPWECVGGRPGVGPGGRHSRDTQGAKGPATTAFLSSRENYKQMWTPQGGVEEGAQPGQVNRESETGGVGGGGCSRASAAPELRSQKETPLRS